MPLSHLKLPTITTPPIKPHTLGNELQMKILSGIWLSNLLLMYLCVFFTIKLIGIDK